MTREEAIKVLERISEGAIQRDCSTCGRPTAGIYSGVCCYCSLCEVVPEILKDYHERKHFRSYWTWDGKRKNEALEMAISALRQQEHFRDCTKKVEPITLDELRQMDGEPVWVQSPGVPEYGRWAIVEGVGENCLFLHDDFTCHDYGKTWLAYRQKPEEPVTDRHQMTNADRIRAMSDEELAEFLIDLADDGNLKIREWLQQPAEEVGKHE